MCVRLHACRWPEGHDDRLPAREAAAHGRNVLLHAEATEIPRPVQLAEVPLGGYPSRGGRIRVRVARKVLLLSRRSLRLPRVICPENSASACRRRRDFREQLERERLSICAGVLASRPLFV